MRDLVLKFPSVSVKLLNEYAIDQEKNLLAEIILQNFSLSAKQYLDNRMSVDILSKNFYILFNEKNQETKSLIMGPINSPKYIVTNEKFYEFVENQSEVNECDLILNVNMLPDYSRTHEITLQHLKLFLHIDVL